MASIHASALLVGARAVLVRGPSGAGKSRLVHDLIRTLEASPGGFSRLVADDRAYLVATHGRLMVRPAGAIAGAIEMRGVGIRNLPFEAVAVVGLVVDLDAADAGRMPDEAALSTAIEGVIVPRLPVAAGQDALPLVLARCLWLESGRTQVAATHQGAYP
jgi:HPr kinase/phosphorylase